MRRLVVLLVLWCGGVIVPPSYAQTPDVFGESREESRSLGEEVRKSSDIAVLKVVEVDRTKGTITFKPIADLKGKCPAQEIEHVIRGGGLDVSDVRDVLEWAQPGKTAISFAGEGEIRTCIGSYWYVATTTEKECRALHAVPATAYIGSTEKLREHVKAILAGREVVITAQIPQENRWDGHRGPVPLDWLRGQKGRVWRIKASIEITGNPTRDLVDSPHFVGWGVGGPEVVSVLARALANEDCFIRCEAANDLVQLGSIARPVLPSLRTALKDSDPFVRLYAAKAVARIDATDDEAIPLLAGLLKHKDQAVRVATAAALADLGPRASAALPILVQILRRDDVYVVRQVAAYSLGAIVPGAERPPVGPKEAVQVLATTLKNDASKVVQEWCIRSLLKFGPAARPALPELARAAQDGEMLVALRAADALARFGPAAVPVLCDALANPKCVCRAVIAEYLGDMNTGAKPAIPTLLTLLQETGGPLQMTAAEELVRIDPTLKEFDVVPTLLEFMKEEKNAERPMELLARMGSRAKAAVPTLSTILEDREAIARVRYHAAVILGKLGPDPRAAAALRTALADEDSNLCKYAFEALVRMGRGKDVLDTLVKTWDGKEKHPGVFVADMLAQIGPDARSVLPMVRRALQDKDHPLSVELAFALWKIEEVVEVGGYRHDPRQDAVTVLIEVLRSERKGDPYDAAYALWQIGAEAKDAVPALIQASRGDNPTLRRQAADALGSIGPEAFAAVPALTALLKDTDGEIRYTAALALRRIDRRNQAALRFLLRRLETRAQLSSFILRPEEEAALGPDAKSVVPWLVRALRDDDYDVFLDAGRALKRIDPERAAQEGLGGL
jgi:HEAT repeat protein